MLFAFISNSLKLLYNEIIWKINPIPSFNEGAIKKFVNNLQIWKLWIINLILKAKYQKVGIKGNKEIKTDVTIIIPI